jgi:hypothetical protein
MGEDVREELGVWCWGTWEGGKGMMEEGGALVQAHVFAMAETVLLQLKPVFFDKIKIQLQIK